MSMTSRLPGSGLRPALAAALLLGALAAAAPAYAADCGRPCVEVADSVVNAAGTDHKLKLAIEALRFDGARVAAASKGEVKQIATAWAKTPSGVLTLTVHADRGLSGSRARGQVSARAMALERDLVAAGLPKVRVQVVAAK